MSERGFYGDRRGRLQSKLAWAIGPDISIHFSLDPSFVAASEETAVPGSIAVVFHAAKACGGNLFMLLPSHELLCDWVWVDGRGEGN